MQRLFSQPRLPDATSVQDLDEFMLLTFAGEESLKEASVSRFVKYFITADVESVDKSER